jgi:hypothetical protein
MKKIYDFADENFERLLDFETLFTKYSEIEILKRLLLDSKQIKLFEFISKLNHLRTFYTKLDENETFLFKDYKDIKYQEIVENIEELGSREQSKDIKLINFLTNILYK